MALVEKYESWMDGTVVTLDEDKKYQRFSIKNSLSSQIKTIIKRISTNLAEFSTILCTVLRGHSKALGDNEYYEQVLK